MMPYIDVDALNLTEAQRAIVKGIISTRGENKGRLRASKPKVAKKVEVKDDSWLGSHYEYASEKDANSGITAYVWRMVAFFVSPIAQHHCMPCTATFDLPGSVKEAHELAKQLDTLIVDPVVNSIKISEWHGVRRWGQVYGQIGTPITTPEGAIIYR